MHVIQKSEQCVAEGRRDEAARLLRAHLLLMPKDHAARRKYLQILRTSRQDTSAIARLLGELGVPATDYLGPSYLRSEAFLDSSGALDEGTRTSPARWLAHLEGFARADQALTLCRDEEARQFLRECPPNALPIPWHFLHARLSLSTDKSSKAAHSALVSLTVCIILMPECGIFYRFAGEAFRRLGNSEAAITLFGESLSRYQRNWTDAVRPLPATAASLRGLSAIALYGRPSARRLLLFAKPMALALRVARKAATSLLRRQRP